MFKSLKLKICAGLLALVGLVGGAAAISQVKPIETRAEDSHTSSLVFTAKCNGSGTADDGVVWTVASDSAESAFDARGIHYGTGSVAVSYLTLTTSDITSTITKIVVNAAGNSGTTAKLNVGVGGNSFDAEKLITSSSTDYEFNGSASGTITVSLTQASTKKALYCKSIIVTYISSTPSSSEDSGQSSDESGESSIDPIVPTDPTVLIGTNDTYKLVTDISSLQENDYIVITSIDTTYALGAQTNNNRSGTAVTNQYLDADTQIIQLGRDNNYWTFNVGEAGYLYAASSSSNYLRTQATNNTNGQWEIVLTEDGMNITAQGSNTRNVLQYNSTYKLFSCYASGQQPVNIYRNVLTPFVNTCLKMDPNSSDYIDTANTGYEEPRCANNYSAAKEAWTHIDSTSKAFFCNHSGPLAEAYERLLAWAHANGEDINANYEFGQAARTIFTSTASPVLTPALLWVLSTGMIGLMAIGLLAFVSYKRYN